MKRVLFVVVLGMVGMGCGLVRRVEPAPVRAPEAVRAPSEEVDWREYSRLPDDEFNR